MAAITASVVSARAGARRRWKSLVALGVFAGLVGAVVLGVLAGARRTESALGRLERIARSPDALVRFFGDVGDAPQLIASLEEVDESWSVLLPVGRILPSYDWVTPLVGVERPSGMSKPVLVEGRLPDPSRVDEVYVTQRTSRRYPLGTVVSIGLYTPEEYSLFESEVTRAPHGPRFELRVVGVVRDPLDVVTAVTSNKILYGTPALAREVEPWTRFWGVFVRVDDRDGRLASFLTKAEQIAEGANPTHNRDRGMSVEVTEPDFRLFQSGPVRVLVLGLLVFAVVVFVVGAAAYLQISSRWSARPLADHAVLRALGFGRRQRVLALALPGFVVAGIAAVVAVAGAIATSPLFPFGAARVVEARPGVTVDAVVLLPGLVATAAVIIALSFAVALVQSRSVIRGPSDRLRTSPITRLVATVTSSAPLGLGTQMATQRGRGRVAVPVRSTLVGVTAGTIVIVAIAAFAASADRTAFSPRRFGVPSDLTIEFAAADLDRGMAELAQRADISAVGVQLVGPATIGTEATYVFTLDTRKGRFPVPLLTGREPAAPDEITLGPKLLRKLGKAVGDHISVTAPGVDEGVDPTDMIIVGAALTPTIQSEAYASQAWATPEAIRTLQLPHEGVTVAVRFAPGVDRPRLEHELDARYPRGVQDESPPDVPRAIGNLAELGGLLWTLPLFVAAMMAVAVMNSLVAGVRHRSSDLAILRSLGLSQRQTVHTVLWMATTTLAIGLLIGVPLGLLVGGAAWRRVAADLDVAQDLVVPVLALATLILLSVGIANILAVVPGRRAASRSPADLLHAQ